MPNPPKNFEYQHSEFCPHCLAHSLWRWHLAPWSKSLVQCVLPGVRIPESWVPGSQAGGCLPPFPSVLSCGSNPLVPGPWQPHGRHTI
jgi:hypothetical protein